MSNQTYWQRLKAHPGVPVATAAPLTALAAGLLREDGAWEVGALGAVVIGVFCWIPVLLTSRNQPVPEDE